MMTLLFLLWMIHYSYGGNIFTPKTKCNSVSYYCPSSRRCDDREVRCTSLETCNYRDNASDNCARNKIFPGAFDVKLGHVRPNFWVPQPLLHHNFIQYRGLTYEFGFGYEGQVLDVNDPFYKYGRISYWTFTKRGLEDVGVSYCDSNDIRFFMEFWGLLPFQKIRNKCVQFTKALELFLISGPCQDRADVKDRFEHNIKIQKHMSEVVDDIVSCAIFRVDPSKTSSMNARTKIATSRYMYFFISLLFIIILQ